MATLVGSAAPLRRARVAPLPERTPDAPRHLRVAPERGSQRRRNRILVWLAFAVTGAALLTLVSFHVFAMQHEFAMTRLQQQRSEEQRRYERLRAEVATLSSPDVIVSEADRLGMVDASTPDYVEAPEVTPPGQSDDRTTSTLDQSWQDAKSSLGADP